MSKRRTAVTPAGTGLPDNPLREQIQQLQAVMEQFPQLDIPPLELFGDRTYVRTIHIPADTYIVGHIHRYACVNLVFGKCKVVSETMGDQEIEGFHAFVSPAGTKRAIHAVSATIWATVHANPDGVERDSDAMADLLTAPSYDVLESHSPK